MRRDVLPGGMRIFVSGAVRVDAENVPARAKPVLAFSRALGRALMEPADGPRAVLITGGRGLPQSADRALVEGARDVLGPGDVSDRVVTFRDPEADYPVEQPFAGTLVVESVGGTRQARRFEMAESADAVVSIAGRIGAQEAVMLGLALDRPSLPLPFTGAASQRLWAKNKKLYLERFPVPDDVVAAWERAVENPRAELTRFATGVAELIRGAATLKCFVAMPYGPRGVESLYEHVVRPAVDDAAYRVVRSDETPTPGRIHEAMLEQISSAAAMIAVISDPRYAATAATGAADRTRPGVNPNVMYEVGYAHALGRPTILLARSKDDLPFDIAADRTLEYAGVSRARLRALVTDALRATRGVRY